MHIVNKQNAVDQVVNHSGDHKRNSK